MTKMLGKITLTTFNPKKILALGEETRELLLGAIVGIANDVKVGADPQGNQFEGLKGDFEAQVIGAEEEIRSGVCFMPDAFQGPIIAQLSDEVDANGVVTREAVKSVAFGFQVFVIRAANAAGYSWQLRPVMAPSANDPLAELRKLVPPMPALAAIAAPTAGKTK
jgi:hypothetical protein